MRGKLGFASGLRRALGLALLLGGLALGLTGEARLMNRLPLLAALFGGRVLGRRAEFSNIAFLAAAALF